MAGSVGNSFFYPYTVYTGGLVLMSKYKYMLFHHLIQDYYLKPQSILKEGFTYHLHKSE